MRHTSKNLILVVMAIAVLTLHDPEHGIATGGEPRDAHVAEPIQGPNLAR